MCVLIFSWIKSGVNPPISSQHTSYVLSFFLPPSRRKTSTTTRSQTTPLHQSWKLRDPKQLCTNLSRLLPPAPKSTPWNSRSQTQVTVCSFSVPLHSNTKTSNSFPPHWSCVAQVPEALGLDYNLSSNVWEGREGGMGVTHTGHAQQNKCHFFPFGFSINQSQRLLWRHKCWKKTRFTYILHWCQLPPCPPAPTRHENAWP